MVLSLSGRAIHKKGVLGGIDYKYSISSQIVGMFKRFQRCYNPEEKAGARPVSLKSNFFLRNFLFEVGDLDISFNGRMFTWCNKQGGKPNIREHLDRVVASLEWRTTFAQAGVFRLSEALLDHIPIQLNMVVDHRK